jgi:hypothetical protein
MPEENNNDEISDQELKQLQKWFIKAERERYDTYNVRESEKQNIVDMF